MTFQRRIRNWIMVWYNLSRLNKIFLPYTIFDFNTQELSTVIEALKRYC